MAKHQFHEDIVEKLVKLLDEHSLTELEYGERHWHVRVSRAASGVVGVTASQLGAPAEAAAPEPALSDAESAASHPGAITSPMVGTVYLAPEPGADSFVKIGDTVTEGQTLLLIEAMKTMNPIQAHRAGKVIQIFAQNASPVEYGEVLVILE